MKTGNAHHVSNGNRTLRWLFGALFVLMVFTGLAQMPIFKRYYVSDIPGMGWSADFYLTHYIHYLGATLMLALIAFVIIDYLFTGRKRYGLTISAYVRIVLLGGIVCTGIFRVLKNLPDIVFSPDFTLFIDIAHLGFMMLYLFSAFIFLLMKSGWIRPNPM